jgi:uncharacterized membrane protein
MLPLKDRNLMFIVEFAVAAVLVFRRVMYS